MTSRPPIGRTRIGLLNTMFAASSALTCAGVELPDSRSLRSGCIVIPPVLPIARSVIATEAEHRLYYTMVGGDAGGLNTQPLHRRVRSAPFQTTRCKPMTEGSFEGV